MALAYVSAMRPKNMILPRRCTAVGSDRAILESFFGSRRGLQLEDLTTKRFQLTRSTSKLSEPPPAYRLERGGGVDVGKIRAFKMVNCNLVCRDCLPLASNVIYPRLLTILEQPCHSPRFHYCWFRRAVQGMSRGISMV